MLNLGIIGCGSVMQGPYMEIVNKLSFKGLVNLKSLSDVNTKIEKIIIKKIRYQYFFKDIRSMFNKIDIESHMIRGILKSSKKA